MGKYNFYYDEIMNTDDTTMSLYSFNSGDATSTVKQRQFRNSTSSSLNDQTKEILRLPLNQDINLTTSFQWSGSPTAMNSLSSELQHMAANAGKTWTNIKNTWANLWNDITDKSARVKTFNQSSFYNINDYTQMFQGMNQSIPLSMRGRIVPYLINGSKYTTTLDQLKKLLNAIYGEKDNSYGQADLDLSGVADDSDPTYIRFLKGVKNLGDSLWNFESTESTGKLIIIKPPHGYLGPPSTFAEDTWITGTLALRFKDKYIFNLLIDSIQLTMSKEMVVGEGNVESPAGIDINLTFVPCTLITPGVIKQYLNLGDSSS